MNNQKGFTLIELLIVMLFVCIVVTFVWNAIKFSSCDFESNYKCEVVHGAGIIIPPLSIITVWFDDDNQ